MANIRAEVMDVLASEDKEKMDFLVDTVHRVGVPWENSTRPVIISQFTMQTSETRSERSPETTTKYLKSRKKSVMANCGRRKEND